MLGRVGQTHDNGNIPLLNSPVSSLRRTHPFFSGLPYSNNGKIRGEELDQYVVLGFFLVFFFSYHHDSIYPKLPML